MNKRKTKQKKGHTNFLKLTNKKYQYWTTLKI